MTSPTTSPSGFIDIDAAIELTGLNRQHLAQLRYTGDGPPFYAITPRKIRYKRSEVVAWMESTRRTRTDTPALAEGGDHA